MLVINIRIDAAKRHHKGVEVLVTLTRIRREEAHELEVHGRWIYKIRPQTLHNGLTG